MSPQSAALALDDSILDVDQVENLIKFCPTKEEMELLKVHTLHLPIISFNYLSDLFCPPLFFVHMLYLLWLQGYTGDKENLGKCEQVNYTASL